MKYMFVSDIHGNITIFDEIINIFKSEKANKIVFLGDTASSYDEMDNLYITSVLNEMSQQIIVIRGNCDTYDFESELHISMYDLDNLYIYGKTITITHGHHYNYLELPNNCGDIFIQGHTHIPMLQEQNGRILANPGSVSRPRGADLRCYLILDKEKIVLKTIEGKEINVIKLVN